VNLRFAILCSSYQQLPYYSESGKLYKTTAEQSQRLEMRDGYFENSTGKLKTENIDISYVVSFVQYLEEEAEAIQSTDYVTLNAEMLEKLLPLLDTASKQAILTKIIEGQSDWKLVEAMLPYIDYMTRQLEAAVVDGALPKEVADMISEYKQREADTGKVGGQ